MSQRHSAPHQGRPIDPDSEQSPDWAEDGQAEAVRERDLPGNPLGPDHPDKARGATRQDGERSEPRRN
jgi:hypothetical protein